MRNRRFPLSKIKSGYVCAEIGVWKAEFSNSILEHNPSHLYLIDPWKSQNFDNRIYSIEQKKLDLIYDGVINRFRNDNRVTVLRSFSNKVEFKNDFFDWVYVDANHSYENVLQDLNFYYPLLKTRGYLCGDDYGWNDKYSNGGPKRAVDEFIAKNKLKLEIKDNQFIIYV